MTEKPTPPDIAWDKVARKTVGGTAWSYLGFLLGKFSTFVATVILANLLLPEQFGLVGYCILGMQFFDIINRFGMDAALISRGKSAESDANTAFLFSLIAASLVYTGAWFAAPWLADFFRAPEVETLFRVLALALLIEPFSLAHSALLSVNLQFRAKLIPLVGRSVVKGVVSILLALNGFGVWSLVWGQLAGALFSTFAFWMVSPWRPKFTFSRRTGIELARYGSTILGVDLIAALRGNLDYAFVGRFLSTGALGLYTMAYRLPELVLRGINGAVGGVAHPMLVGLREDKEHTRQYYIAYIRYLALVTLPIGAGMAVISEPFVLSFYGENWAGAVLPMQAISIALTIASLGYAPGVLYKALNRPDILRNLFIVKLPVFSIALYFAAQRGIAVVAMTQVALEIFYLTLDSFMITRFTKIRFSEMLGALWPAIVSAAGMALFGGSVGWAMQGNGSLELATVIILSVPTYIALVRVMSPSSYREIVSHLKAYLTKRKRRVS